MRQTVFVAAAFVAAVCTTPATPSFAQTAQPAPSTTPPASATPPATTEQTASTQPAAVQPQQNARLAAGGIVGGKNASPLHLTATFDTTLGNGTFVSGFGFQPSLSNTLSLRPSWSLPTFDVLPKMILAGSLDIFVNNWFSAFGNLGIYDRQVRQSDWGTSLIFPGLLKESITGISATPILNIRLPLSVASRYQNRIISGAVGLQATWASPDLPIGSFFAQYVPSLRGNAYSDTVVSIPCDGVAIASRANPLNGTDEIPLIAPREEQVLANGECAVPGRQVLAQLSNSVATGWSMGEHTVFVSLAWLQSYVRALADAPELNSPYSTGQSFFDQTSSSVSYTYQVPVDFNLQLTAGIFSSQFAYDNQGNLRNPFWDFYTPANNLSGFFFDLTMGI